jgi:hypothetical protein
MQFILACPLIGCTTGARRRQMRRLTFDVSEDDLRAPQAWTTIKQAHTVALFLTGAVVQLD